MYILSCSIGTFNKKKTYKIVLQLVFWYLAYSNLNKSFYETYNTVFLVLANICSQVAKSHCYTFGKIAYVCNWLSACEQQVAYSEKYLLGQSNRLLVARGRLERD